MRHFLWGEIELELIPIGGDRLSRSKCIHEKIYTGANIYMRKKRKYVHGKINTGEMPTGGDRLSRSTHMHAYRKKYML